MGKLTDIKLRALIRKGDPANETDGDGLTFTLSKTGVTTWTLRFRIGGRQKELTLGRYPDIGIAKAREMAAEARVKVNQGVDVALEKQIAKNARIAAWTFRELAEDYQTKRLPSLAPNTQKQQRHHIRLANAKLGATPIRQVEGSDVVGLIRKVGEKSYTVAEAVLSVVSSVFKHGIALGAVTTNPCAHIEIASILGTAPPVRERLMLTEKELREILPALDMIGVENALTVKIALATCVRIGELAKAEWAHLDFDGTARWTQPNGDAIDLPHPKWLIPVENQKTGKTTGRHFIIPLLPEVIAWFKALRPFAGSSPFVLPARQSRRRKTFGGEIHFDQRALNSMLHKLADRMPDKFRRFTPHDLRSTARSHLTSLGVDPLIAERCLNHTVSGLVAIYDKGDYWRQRTIALTVWTSFISACESGEAWRHPDNVIQLRGAA